MVKDPFYFHWQLDNSELEKHIGGWSDFLLGDVVQIPL